MTSEGRPRWHPRGTNNGLIFGATYFGVTHLPERVSYAIGHGGTWLASKLQRRATSALVENLRLVRPGASDAELRDLAATPSTRSTSCGR
jgi:lauroyl/myristoyl acyltransferase